MFRINCDYNSVNTKLEKNNVQVLRHITSLQKQALQLGKSYKCLCSEIVAKFVFLQWRSIFFNVQKIYFTILKKNVTLLISFWKNQFHAL